MPSSIRPGTLIILLILCVIVVWQRRTLHELRQHENKFTTSMAPDPQETGPATPSIASLPAPTPPKEHPPFESDQALRERIANLESQLAEFNKPLQSNIRSATVDTEVLADETLILFLRPERAVLDDGRVAVKLSGTVIGLSEEHLKGSAVEGLATNASNTIQHGEAWQNTEAESTLDDLRESSTVSMPSVITLPGQAAQINVQDGLQYKVTPEFLENGKDFRIRLRMEHPSEATETNK